MSGLASRHRENNLKDSITDSCAGCKRNPPSQNAVWKISYNEAEQEKSA